MKEMYTENIAGYVYMYSETSKKGSSETHDKPHVPNSLSTELIIFNLWDKDNI